MKRISHVVGIAALAAVLALPTAAWGVPVYIDLAKVVSDYCGEGCDTDAEPHCGCADPEPEVRCHDMHQGNEVEECSELGLLSAVLADDTLPAHQGVYDAWTHNRAQLDSDWLQPAFDYPYRDMLCGYMTLGDIGPDHTTGNVNATIVWCTFYAAANIDKNDYDLTQESVISVWGDADGDGYTNKEEYDFFYYLEEDREVGRAMYIQAALDPLTTPTTPNPPLVEPGPFEIDCEAMNRDPGPPLGIDPSHLWLVADQDFCGGAADADTAVRTCDLDSNGMIDSWEVAIVGAVLCDPGHALYAAVDAAYQANVTALEGEGVAAEARPFVAAHMLCSQSAIDFWVATYSLVGTYAPFTSGVEEPLSPGGDLDGDEYTNQDEYDNTWDWEGGRSDFYAAVADPEDEGYPLPLLGIVGLGLLAGACAIGSACVIRKRKRREAT